MFHSILLFHNSFIGCYSRTHENRLTVPSLVNFVFVVVGIAFVISGAAFDVVVSVVIVSVVAFDVVVIVVIVIVVAFDVVVRVCDVAINAFFTGSAKSVVLHKILPVTVRLAALPARIVCNHDVVLKLIRDLFGQFFGAETSHNPSTETADNSTDEGSDSGKDHRAKICSRRCSSKAAGPTSCN